MKDWLDNYLERRIHWIRWFSVGDNNYRVVGIFKGIQMQGQHSMELLQVEIALMAVQLASEFEPMKFKILYVHVPDVKLI